MKEANQEKILLYIAMVILKRQTVQTVKTSVLAQDPRLEEGMDEQSTEDLSAA